MLHTEEPGGGRRHRKRRQTMNHLAAAAMSLFRSRGYDAVTMEQIADAADVARGTLYNHFPQKDALVAHWVEEQLAADLSRLAPMLGGGEGIAAKLELLLGASADWCEAHREDIQRYLRAQFSGCAGLDGPGAAAGNALRDAFVQVIGQAQSAGELQAEPPAEHLADLLNYLYAGALVRWLASPGLSLRAEVMVVIGLFLHGSAASPSPSSSHN